MNDKIKKINLNYKCKSHYWKKPAVFLIIEYNDGIWRVELRKYQIKHIKYSNMNKNVYDLLKNPKIHWKKVGNYSVWDKYESIEKIYWRNVQIIDLFYNK